MHMNPAAYVISVFDGVRPLARRLNLDPSVVCRWALPKAKRGQDGLIPAKYQGEILRLAKKMKLPLSAEQLIRK